MTDELINKIFKLISELGKLTEEYKQDIFSNQIAISELKPGDEFKFSGFGWVLLGDEQNGKLAIVTESIGDYMFDENGCNDWSESSLRKFLNSKFVEKLCSTNLMPFVSDLTADDGHTEYGCAEDLVFILSDVLHRKYRREVTKYTEASHTWTITPYSTMSDYDYYERAVSSVGIIEVCHADNRHGVMPAILLNPETLVKKINN